MPASFDAYIGALISVVGVLVSVVVALATRRKLLAEARQAEEASEASEAAARGAISDAAVRLVRPLEERIGTLESELIIAEGVIRDQVTRIDVLIVENQKLQAGVELLSHQIVAFGQQPIFKWGG